MKASDKSLGRRRVKVPTVTKYKTPWFNGDVKILETGKRQAFLKYKSIRTPEEYANYKSIRNLVNSKIRIIKDD